MKRPDRKSFLTRVGDIIREDVKKREDATFIVRERQGGSAADRRIGRSGPYDGRRTGDR